MTVYVVQNQQRFDREKGELVPKFPSVKEKAGKFGELKYLLSPTAAPWDTVNILKEMWGQLQHYKDGDYLLLIGNPLLIGLAVALATEANNGEVTVLQWSGERRSYIPIKADLKEDVYIDDGK